MRGPCAPSHRESHRTRRAKALAAPAPGAAAPEADARSACHEHAAGTLRSADRARAYGCVRAQSLDLVGELPRHAEIVTPEVPIGRGGQIDRAAQVHAVDDRARPPVEMPAYEVGQPV